MHFDCTTESLLTIDDFYVVYKWIHPVRKEWHSVGSELGLHVDDLENIEVEHTRNKERLMRVLAIWLRSESLKPTWQKLIDALNSITVQHGDTAADIQEFLDSRSPEAQLVELEVN